MLFLKIYTYALTIQHCLKLKMVFNNNTAELSTSCKKMDFILSIWTVF